MKQKNYTKPTINQLTSSIIELQNVLNFLVQEHQDLKAAFASYIDFKGDTDKWIKWINNKVKNSEKTSKKTPTSSKKKKVG